jgi:integrase
MQMPIFIRSRRQGRAFELRITHPLLKKKEYRTLRSQHEAEVAGAQAEKVLDSGQIPAWLLRPEDKKYKTIRDAIRGLLAISGVKPSVERLLMTIDNDIGNHPLAEVNYAWAESWIQAQKGERRSTPGTIRKKKSRLSTVFHWLTKNHPLCLASNPLPDLPHGYSAYDINTRENLGRQGIEVPEDGSRDRRIDRSEERLIVAEIERRLARATTDQERAEAEGLWLMFVLALCTCMRMREIYTLTVDQIQLEKKTIFLEKTKNGWSRQVPLGSHAMALLRRAWPALEAVRKGGRLLPFWDGSLQDADLTRTTSIVSKLFADVFAKAGSEGLHFHDTRHEAVCRWVLEAPQPLSDSYLAKFAAMTDSRTRHRYLSLRAFEMADLLG